MVTNLEELHERIEAALDDRDYESGPGDIQLRDFGKYPELQRELRKALEKRQKREEAPNRTDNNLRRVFS